jgi:hypothetical protein
MRVQAKRPSYNSVAYYVVAEARPTPLVSKLYTLYYKADVLMDVYTLLPQRAGVYSEEGQRHQMKVTTFNNAARKATFEHVSAKSGKREAGIYSAGIYAGRTVCHLRHASPAEGRRKGNDSSQHGRSKLSRSGDGRGHRAVANQVRDPFRRFACGPRSTMTPGSRAAARFICGSAIRPVECR